MDNVETLKEQFDGDVYFRARWREPKLDNVKVRVNILLNVEEIAVLITFVKHAVWD
jgi:hypothetical protein